MKEHLTEAIVLNTRFATPADRLVDFYTKNLGRLEAKVRGGIKILSKLSPHLDYLNLVTLRLVSKNKYLVADAISQDDFRDLKENAEFYEKASRIVYLIAALTPPELPDLKLWYELIRSFRQKNFSCKNILKILGYDSKEAICEECSSKQPTYFFVKDQRFFCAKCRAKLLSDELIYIA
jgi:DNA repair protein RecO